MADITVTASQVGIVYPNAVIYDFVASAAVTAGQAVYQTSTGKVAPADANAAGKQQFRGIALKGAAAGEAVSVLKEGHVYGFGVSGLNADALIYLSDTEGALADGAGTMTVIAGRVFALPDGTKVLYILADWLRAWS